MASLERSATPHRFRYLVATIPALCGLLGAFVANIPVSVLGGLVPAPLFALVPVYFWCLVRPDLMTPGIALMIGGDLHEHLGQLIAYARSNKVTPPWSK